MIRIPKADTVSEAGKQKAEQIIQAVRNLESDFDTEGRDLRVLVIGKMIDEITTH